MNDDENLIHRLSSQQPDIAKTILDTLRSLTEKNLGPEEQNKVLHGLIDTVRTNGTDETKATLLPRYYDMIHENEAEIASREAAKKKKRRSNRRLIAIVTCIALLIAVTFITTNSTARNWFTSFYHTIFGADHVSTSTVQTVDTMLQDKYAPTLIPAGFALAAKLPEETILVLTYASSNGQQINYYQFGGTVASDIDTEFTTVKPDKINGMDVFLCSGGDGINAIIGTIDDTHHFRLQGDVPLEILVEMAESIAFHRLSEEE